VLDLLCYHTKFQTLGFTRLIVIQFQKKNFQNFQKIELWGSVKGIFEPKFFDISPYYNPRAIQKKNKVEIFTIGLFVSPYL
jgi:hypothetical protein